MFYFLVNLIKAKCEDAYMNTKLVTKSAHTIGSAQKMSHAVVPDKQILMQGN